MSQNKKKFRVNKAMLAGGVAASALALGCTEPQVAINPLPEPEPEVSVNPVFDFGTPDMPSDMSADAADATSDAGDAGADATGDASEDAGD